MRHAKVVIDLFLTSAILAASAVCYPSDLPSAETVRASLNARYGRISSYSFAWTMRQIMPAGSQSEAAARVNLPNPGDTAEYPVEKKTLHWKGTFAFDGKSSRCDYTGEWLVKGEVKPDVWRMVHIFTDHMDMRWMGAQPDFNIPATASMDKETPLGRGMNLDPGMIFAIDVVSRGQILSGFEPLRMEGTEFGEMCVFGNPPDVPPYPGLPPGAFRVEYYLDPAHGFRISKVIRLSNSGQFDSEGQYLSYSLDPQVGWKPGVIRVLQGMSSDIMEIEVGEIAINPKFDPPLTQFALPVGTVVEDGINANGVRYPIDAATGGASWMEQWANAWAAQKAKPKP